MRKLCLHLVAASVAVLLTALAGPATAAADGALQGGRSVAGECDGKRTKKKQTKKKQTKKGNSGATTTKPKSAPFVM